MIGGVPYETSWDISRIYKAAAAAMSIAPDQHSEQVIKQIPFWGRHRRYGSGRA